MLEGLNSAAAGMAAQRQRLDAVANDLANTNTTGYKRVRVGFQDLVYSQAGKASEVGVRIGAGARAVDAGRTMAQGALQRTDRPLDVAIQGDGFLQVTLPDGRAALTRDGALQVTGSGRLATSDGALLRPGITIPAGTPTDAVAISGDGTVTASGRPVGRLQLVSVRSPQLLQSVGGNAFVATPQSGAPGPARAAAITQGALEMSNVEVSEAMVAMIEAQRSFELASKAIHTADQMMEIANGVKR
jgi:flagellar basal-body rod protein FlgG